ncbi:MAG: Cna B-type domain-containing protein [Lachnospiraceae bacterium]|nr:Cna B-type domain-containing protein [Lachnospiraceae bacterium]
MKKRIRRILSGVLCAALLAAFASPEQMSAAESETLSEILPENGTETDTETLKTETGNAETEISETAITEAINTELPSADASGENSNPVGMDEGSDDASLNTDTNANSADAAAAEASEEVTDGENTDTVEITDGPETETAEESYGSAIETEVLEDAMAASVNSLSLESDDEDTESGINVNKSYVSALTVKSLTDGTAPFDDDDEAGNDAGADNRIVRTFDYVNYTLEYTTALMDPTETVDEAYLMVAFTLACDPSVAEFNTDTLNWCVDQAVTYVYDDGTSSSQWDKEKTVTEQVLTGKRYLSKSGDANAIPGTGTLSVGIYVKAAKNGAVIQPDFMVWMEGNEESLYQNVSSEAVKISAMPRYNINLVRNASCSYLAYFDTQSGTISSEDTDGSVYGRLEGYALTLQLYNSSVDKGLKGIELPSGNITFDLTLTETLDGTDVSSEENYTPILWDYRENEAASLTTVGKLGRAMAAGGSVSTAYGVRCQPFNSGGASSIRSCYSGGGWNIVQDTENTSIYHVTVSGYSFDLDQLNFPTTSCDNMEPDIYGANIGCFSAGYVQVVVSFARNVESTSNLYFWIEAGSLAASSLSGQLTASDQRDSDNSSGMNVTLYEKGSITKRNHFNTTDFENRASEWSAGDFYAVQGEQILVKTVVDYSGDGYLSSVNILQKIDDDAFEIPDGTTSCYAVSLCNEQSKAGSIRVLFAAKPDKTGWQSETEMNDTHEEALIYFESIDALNAAGYTCVGFLYEIRDCELYMGSENPAVILLYMLVDVKESAEIGSVYSTTNDVRAWRNCTDVISWTEFSYGGGAYGLGAADWSLGSYADGYQSPEHIRYMEYEKAVYENGSIVAGHTGGYQAGNSCLIIGCKTGVSIQVADTTSTTAGTTISKSVYDLDIGERTVTYLIHPEVTTVSENNEVSSSTEVTDVTIWATLPANLTYIMNSASLAPSQVRENDDGTSTVIWELPSQTAGEAIEGITLSCLIGAAGTADDVQNNENITISTSIMSDKDHRLITGTFGNYSETTIRVIRLASTSISKDVERSIVEEGEELTYVLRYGNSAEEEASGVMLYDILPYDGDTRGSEYSGSYVLESILLDFSNAPGTFADGKNSIRITRDEDAGEESAVEAILNGSDSYSWTEISGGKINGSAISFMDMSVSGASGILFDLGTVNAQEYVKITITLAVKDSSGELIKDNSGEVQASGDIYANSFYEYADGQAALVESNTVKIQVAERIISGIAWIDADGDGIRDNKEERIEGMTVSLYRTSASVYDTMANTAAAVNNTKLYTAYDVFGNCVKAALTDAEGNYCFNNLESGTYYVVFTGTEAYGLTIRNSGTDESVNSDAAATIIRTDETVLENAWISDISMPVLDEMYAYLYESGNLDAGFVELSASLTIIKTEQGTGTPLGGAVFTLQDTEGKYLTFADGSYIGRSSQPGKEAYLTTGTDGAVIARHLPTGLYTLSEYQAPEGYQLLADTQTVKVATEAADGVWSAQLLINDTRTETLTVTDTAKTTTLTVKKVWEDNDNQDGLRADAVFSLTGAITGENGVKTTVVSKEAVLSCTAAEQRCVFNDLPAYVSGQVVSYTVTETRIKGYTTTCSSVEGDWKSGYSVTVTNTHEAEETAYSVKKEWEDDENRDGIRPTGIEVTLFGSDGSVRTATVTEKEGWKYTFTEWPVYWNAGTRITYRLEEAPVEGYESEVADADSTQLFELTNTHKITLTDVSVEKIWDDENDQDGARTSVITVTLTGSDGSTREAELTEEGEWKYTFEELPKYWREGTLITYSLQEKEIDGYTEEVLPGEDGYSFAVTNNHIPAVTDVVVLKNWEDADNQDGVRPESILVRLSGNDGSSYEAELTEDSGYSFLFSGLPVYYNHGTVISYSVSETDVGGYTTETVQDSDYQFTITNTHIPETTEVTVNKIWQDEENRDGVRADFLRVTLTGSDGSSYTADLTEEKGWSETFTGLPVYYCHGEKVVYTIQEDPTAYYDAELTTSEDGYMFTFINTHEIFTTERTVVKLWEDEDDQDGIRPDTVDVLLIGSDGSQYTAVLTAAENWTYTFMNLPQYIDGGEEILYSLSETEIEGYTSSVAETEEGFLLTNQHTPEPETETESETESETETERATNKETETESETPSESESETENGKTITSDSSDGSPKTGDPSRPLFWFILALAGLGLIGANLSCTLRRKRKAA